MLTRSVCFNDFIPMGTNCAPLVANLNLFWDERDFIFMLSLMINKPLLFCLRVLAVVTISYRCVSGFLSVEVARWGLLVFCCHTFKSVCMVVEFSFWL